MKFFMRFARMMTVLDIHHAERSDAKYKNSFRFYAKGAGRRPLAGEAASPKGKIKIAA